MTIQQITLFMGEFCFLVCFYSVEIFREPDVSLGISIVGGQTVIKRLKNGEELKGIFIKQVLEVSPAGKTNALKTGDKILEVNNVKFLFLFEMYCETVNMCVSLVYFIQMPSFVGLHNFVRF